MMHVGGYYDACGGIRGCSVHWGDTMSTAGDIMSSYQAFYSLKHYNL